MKNHAKRVGDLSRETLCPFCGQPHRRRGKEARDCRARARAGKGPVARPEPTPQAEAHHGSEVTRYQADPLKGDKRAHAIARQLRQGVSPRLIAKRLNVPLGVVNQVRDKLAQP